MAKPLSQEGYWNHEVFRTHLIKLQEPETLIREGLIQALDEEQLELQVLLPLWQGRKVHFPVSLNHEIRGPRTVSIEQSADLVTGSISAVLPNRGGSCLIAESLLEECKASPNPGKEHFQHGKSHRKTKG